MPSRHLNSLWPKELSQQCARLQTQSSHRPLNSLTHPQRSLYASLSNPRSSPSELQTTHIRPQTPAPISSANAGGRRFASLFSRTGPGSIGETYVAYGMTQKLFEACNIQGDYKIPQLQEKGAEIPKTGDGEHIGVGESWWYKELGLMPTFSTWSQITFLHMYLLTVRLRALPSRESFQTYSRHLIDHFSHNAENRMDVLHGLTSRSIRNKFLKDLFIQWRGVLAAYDEGLIKGDAVLGAAIWRNLWKASYHGPDEKEIDWEKVARVVAYMRRVTSELAKLDEGELIMKLVSGNSKSFIFSPSEADKQLVGGRR
ncbi:ubiquinol-cytochrome C chaperone-domain-containing protein [Aspergillus carlsbadensis]|nr:ubiquinol-cytochrome C chaperone-domain-containing protein [Aspergillus carlsbadensis]